MSVGGLPPPRVRPDRPLAGLQAAAAPAVQAVPGRGRAQPLPERAGDEHAGGRPDHAVGAHQRLHRRLQLADEEGGGGAAQQDQEQHQGRQEDHVRRPPQSPHAVSGLFELHLIYRKLEYDIGLVLFLTILNLQTFTKISLFKSSPNRTPARNRARNRALNPIFNS